MEENILSQNKSLIQSLASDLSPDGGRRCLLLVGRDRHVKPVVENLAKLLIDRQESYLWIDFDGRSINSPESWISNLARNLRAGRANSTAGLGEFARETGRLLTPFGDPANENSSEDNNKDTSSVLSKFLKLYEDHFSIDGTPEEFMTPVLSLSNLNDFSDDMLTWMSGKLNLALRQSKAFENARFVFTSPAPDSRVTDFFNRFGFEKILRYVITPPKNFPDNKLATKENTFTEPLTKGLKKTMKSDTVHKQSMASSNKDRNDITQRDISSFSANGQKFLELACLPSLINRYTLEFFCESKDSAFCYNWLLRQPAIAKPNADGFLVLNKDIRKKALASLREKDGNAESKEILASVLDTFMKLFPDPETHWIPVNLQMFASFTPQLLKELFDSLDYDQIMEFISDHKEHFISDNDYHNLNDEAKMVTKRLMELTELSPIGDLKMRVEEKWHSDQEQISERKNRIIGKKSSLEQEIEDIKEQITQFDQMRNQIKNEFEDPKNYRTRKVITFSTVLPILILGIGSIGASLFSESFGTYHAACGLFLTFIGFFWPNIEIQKPDPQIVGGKPKLTVETQQRSLNHRISGLINRASSLKGTLSQLDGELETLELGTQVPYLA